MEAVKVTLRYNSLFVFLDGGNSTPLHVMVLCPHLVQYFRNNGTRYYLLQYHIEEYFKSSDESMLNESNHDEI